MSSFCAFLFSSFLALLASNFGPASCAIVVSSICPRPRAFSGRISHCQRMCPWAGNKHIHPSIHYIIINSYYFPPFSGITFRRTLPWTTFVPSRTLPASTHAKICRPTFRMAKSAIWVCWTVGLSISKCRTNSRGTMRRRRSVSIGISTTPSAESCTKIHSRQLHIFYCYCAILTLHGFPFL
jgi:hypothetical protein